MSEAEAQFIALVGQSLSPSLVSPSHTATLQKSVHTVKNSSGLFATSTSVHEVASDETFNLAIFKFLYF